MYSANRSPIKKQKSAVHVKPTRRSARSTVKVADNPDSEAESSLHVSPDDQDQEVTQSSKPSPEVPSNSSTIHTRSSQTEEDQNYKRWMEKHGNQLFDCVSNNKVLEHTVAGFAFDSDFYEDQKDPDKRLLVMEVMKVTREFYEQEKCRERQRAVAYQHRISQYADTVTSVPSGEVEDSDNQESKRSVHHPDYKPGRVFFFNVNGSVSFL